VSDESSELTAGSACAGRLGDTPRGNVLEITARVGDEKRIVQYRQVENCIHAAHEKLKTRFDQLQWMQGSANELSIGFQYFHATRNFMNTTPASNSYSIESPCVAYG